MIARIAIVRDNVCLTVAVNGCVLREHGQWVLDDVEHTGEVQAIEANDDGAPADLAAWRVDDVVELRDSEIAAATRALEDALQEER